jgi:hypothetical protein
MQINNLTSTIDYEIFHAHVTVTYLHEGSLNSQLYHLLEYIAHRDTGNVGDIPDLPSWP